MEHHKSKSGATIIYKITEAESFDDATRVIEEWDMKRREGDTILVYAQDGAINTINVEGRK